MSDFGRQPNFDSYGFTWPGGPDYEPPKQPRCHFCSGFLSWEPDEREPFEDTEPCDGILHVSEEDDNITWTICGDIDPHEPHVEVMAFGETLKTKCRKCGEMNVDRGY